MLRGLYNGAAALDVLARGQEIISANLANLNTSGYRAASIAVSQRNAPTGSAAPENYSPEVARVQLDFSPGRLAATDRALDISISGDGFFEYASANGPVYSRSGQLYRNTENGQLANSEGLPIQDENGQPISIPAEISDRDISITEDGTVSAAGDVLGQIKVVSFNDNQLLTPISHTYFRPSDQVQQIESSAGVLQYHQEFSNTSAVSQLVALVVGARQYEAVQKVSTTVSETLQEHIQG